MDERLDTLEKLQKVLIELKEIEKDEETIANNNRLIREQESLSPCEDEEDSREILERLDNETTLMLKFRKKPRKIKKAVKIALILIAMAVNIYFVVASFLYLAELPETAWINRWASEAPVSTEQYSVFFWASNGLIGLLLVALPAIAFKFEER